AMCSATSVGIYDNLPAGESDIAVWTANHKFPGRIHMINNIAAKQVLHALRQFGLYPRNKDVNYIILDFVQHEFVSIKFVVLSRYHNGVHFFRNVVIGILNSNLRFGIWTKVSHYFSFAPDDG